MTYALTTFEIFGDSPDIAEKECFRERCLMHFNCEPEVEGELQYRRLLFFFSTQTKKG